ncbi:MAG: aldehyde dehydrogenase family protein, partial [Sphingomonadales bacterium]|nr:aldehyde dehydrogenase family protein [Sphingomonadales bacterium]
MDIQTGLFIENEFVDAADGGTIDVLNPHDNSTICAVAEARQPDIDAAVAAARRAFPGWRDTPAAERGHLLLKLADAIEANADELARLESVDTGHPLKDTSVLDVP